jgi:hypothetical protein
MDTENQSTQIILTSIAIFLFFVIVTIIYRTNRNCKNVKTRIKNKEKYEEIKLKSQDKEFLDKNVYQNTGLGKKDYEYLVNYPNGKFSWGEWSWGSNLSNNCNGGCYYTETKQNIPFKQRNINSLFKF